MFGTLSEREQAIVDLLADETSLSVTEMSKRLSVSAVTIRGDLASLAEKGVIVREHGSASAAFSRSILERQRTRVQEKKRIAKAAASLVGDGDTVMIEAGTTTALITRYFLGKRDLHVVTNSMLVISFARFNPAIRVTVVGGEFRASTESVVGPLAAKGLDEFHVGTAFIGTDGFSMEHGLTTHLVEGAEIVRKMREQSDRTVLVADSSKYGKAGFTRILPINAIDHLVTDVELPPDAARAIRDLGPTVDLV